MLGQGITPQQHHQIADLMDDRELGGFLDEIRTRVERTVAQLPQHLDYVTRYAPATKPMDKPMPTPARAA